VVTDDSAGVLLHFRELGRAEAQAKLDALAGQQGLEGQLRVGFVRTKLATLAALYLGGREPVTVKRLQQLALAASRLDGVAAAYAFLHPGPRNDQLELEAWWGYARGAPTGERRLAFRDDDGWVQWARRRLSFGELELRKWPLWPLSALAVTLGLPGRVFLERPRGMLDLATWPAPTDVGENLVLNLAFLPNRTVLEMRQLAEKSRASLSKVVQDALISSEAEANLGVSPAESLRAPWDLEMPEAEKAQYQEVQLYFAREVMNRLDAKIDEDAVNLSRLVDFAWRRAHPYVEKKP
jgi:hypothetical protein